MTEIIRRISLSYGLQLGQLEAIKETSRLPRKGQTQSGYGRRMPTRYLVRLKGDRHWRRVYCACYSNAGTCYVPIGNDWIVIED